MGEIVVRCRPKQFEILVIEVELNILNWVPILDELLVDQQCDQYDPDTDEVI